MAERRQPCRQRAADGGPGDFFLPEGPDHVVQADQFVVIGQALRRHVVQHEPAAAARPGVHSRLVLRQRPQIGGRGMDDRDAAGFGERGQRVRGLAVVQADRVHRLDERRVIPGHGRRRGGRPVCSSGRSRSCSAGASARPGWSAVSASSTSWLSSICALARRHLEPGRCLAGVRRIGSATCRRTSA